MTHLLRRSLFSLLLLALGLSIAVAAELGPDYERPASKVPEHFKNVTWREGAPAAHLPKGEWWKIFRDAKLNELEARATANNQELKGAIARFDQARTTARMAKSDLYPVLGITASAERQQTSQNMPSPFPLNGMSYEGAAYNVLFDFNWELDLWGTLRRNIESSQRDSLSTASAVHNLLLGIQAEVASAYFQIRSLDSEIRYVREAVGWRGEALKIARARVNAGTANDLEVAQSETEVAAAEAEISVLQAQRDQLENAIAILIGTSASSFRLSAGGSLGVPPRVPAGLPSDLLERRPDVAAAEHQLAASTARIGIAKAEFFPSVSLMGNIGYQSGDADILLSTNSVLWNYGPQVRIPLFSGGKNRFNLSRAHAQHDEALSTYRQAFLAAISDVETSLSAIRHLGTQSEAVNRARTTANQAARLAHTQYKAGTAPYLDVISANRTALDMDRSAVRVAGQRMVASVSLIKALGGGWDQTRTLDFPEVKKDAAALSDPEKTETSILKKMFQKKKEGTVRAETLTAEGSEKGWRLGKVLKSRKETRD